MYSYVKIVASKLARNHDNLKRKKIYWISSFLKSINNKQFIICILNIVNHKTNIDYLFKLQLIFVW